MNVASSSAHSLMMFEANKKSVGLAFGLWLFLAFVGAHRFYAGRPGSGIAMIILTIFALATLQGPFLLCAAIIWVVVDGFLIPGWIRKYNMDLVSKISDSALA